MIPGQRKHQLRKLKISEISLLSKRDAEAQEHLQTSRVYRFLLIFDAYY